MLLESQLDTLKKVCRNNPITESELDAILCSWGYDADDIKYIKNRDMIDHGFSFNDFGDGMTVQHKEGVAKLPPNVPH